MPERDPNRPLAVGDVLHGFCGGAFGRDSYEDKRIEALGTDWVVCRDESGHLHTATFDYREGWNVEDLREYREAPTEGYPEREGPDG